MCTFQFFDLFLDIFNNIREIDEKNTTFSVRFPEKTEQMMDNGSPLDLVKANTKTVVSDSVLDFELADDIITDFINTHLQELTNLIIYDTYRASRVSNCKSVGRNCAE